jgi:hypothetical protein
VGTGPTHADGGVGGFLARQYQPSHIGTGGQGGYGLDETEKQFERAFLVVVGQFEQTALL